MGVRTEIVNSLVALLQTISPGNGYQTDLGLNVHEWREYAFDTADTPCITVKDTIDEIEPEQRFEDKHGLNVQIGIIASGANTLSNLRDGIDDIYKCLGSVDNIGSLVTTTIWQSAEIMNYHDEEKHGNVEINIQLLYTTPAFDGSKIINV